jgi:hypothetical protein
MANNGAPDTLGTVPKVPSFTFVSTPAREPVVCFWGGGHTAETDPTKKGWRSRPVGDSGRLWLVGQPGKAGCASVMIIPERPGIADVAVYLESPKEVESWLLTPRDTRTGLDARYIQFPAISGVGLRIIIEINKEREMLVASSPAP